MLDLLLELQRIVSLLLTFWLGLSENSDKHVEVQALLLMNMMTLLLIAYAWYGTGYPEYNGVAFLNLFYCWTFQLQSFPKCPCVLLRTNLDGSLLCNTSKTNQAINKTGSTMTTIVRNFTKLFQTTVNGEAWGHTMGWRGWNQTTWNIISSVNKVLHSIYRGATLSSCNSCNLWENMICFNHESLHIEGSQLCFFKFLHNCLYPPLLQCITPGRTIQWREEP